MLTREINLIKIFGIQITLDYSWFFIFVMIIFSFGYGFLPTFSPGHSAWVYFIYALIGATLFFSSVLAHEVAHSVVARKRNLPVKKITLFLFGGASRLPEEPADAKTELLMAIVGPIASFVLGGFFILIGYLVFKLFGKSIITLMLSELGIINLFLGAFNLIPGYPLDGGRVLRALIWFKTKNLQSSTYAAAAVGRIMGYLIILVGVIEALFASFVSGVWLVFIGLFLISAASSGYMLTILTMRLRSLKVGDIMDKSFLVFDKKISAQVLSQAMIQESKRVSLIEDQGEIIGALNLKSLEEIEADRAPEKMIIPKESLLQLKPSDPALDSLNLLNGEAVEPILVYDNKLLSGVITVDRVMMVLGINKSSFK